MRYQLDPLSASGISPVPEKSKTVVRQQQSHGYIGNPAPFSAGTATNLYAPSAEPMPNSVDTIVSNFVSPAGFGLVSAVGTQTFDTTNYIRGSRSLKLTTTGTGGAVFSQKTSISPTFSIVGKQIKVWVYADKPTNITELFFYFSSDNLVANWITFKPSNYINVLKANTWTCLTFSQGRDSQTTGSPTLSAINSLQLRVTDDGTTPVNVNFGEIATFTAPANGVVSLTFDDGYASQFALAKPALDAYEYPATAYIIPTKIDTSTYMTLDNLKTLQGLGWDIANHTYDHPFLSQLSDTEIENEFWKAKDWFIQRGFTKGIHDMALPHGDWNETSVLPIAKKYFRSVRTINNQVETIPAADRFKLRVLYVINTMTLATVKTAVDNAINNNEWLILVFHDIQAVTASQDIQWLSSDFTALADYLNTQGAVVKTVADVLNSPVPSSSASVSDASTSTKGIVQLTNDLGGSATAPTVLATHLSSALPTSQGGTGLNTFTSGTVVTATSTSALATTKTAPAGTIVGTSDTQTLTAKTLTAPKISSGGAPATSTSTGTTGTIAWDSGFIYVCTATNTWVRAALSTF